MSGQPSPRSLNACALWSTLARVPSQRLLKMMDPLGHMATSRRVPASTAPKAVVWAATSRSATWIAAELAAVGVDPLRATSLRHVDASLRIDAIPACSLAVIEFPAGPAASEDSTATLTAARWLGYRGAIIAIAGPGIVSAQIQAIVRIDAVVSPTGSELRRYLGTVSLLSRFGASRA
jgi:hypothetical protein